MSRYYKKKRVKFLRFVKALKDIPKSECYDFINFTKHLISIKPIRENEPTIPNQINETNLDTLPSSVLY